MNNYEDFTFSLDASLEDMPEAFPTLARDLILGK